MNTQIEYSRENPSNRYKNLIAQYKMLHTEGERKLGIPPDQTFTGYSLLPHVDHIKRLIQKYDANHILDYGCGKGAQYTIPIIDVGLQEKELLVDYWNITGVHCYDPCVEEFSELPSGNFDGVISTDMLEHCSEEDVSWIVDEMFSFANSFLYTNIACYPAKKTLPNGENAHCTIKSPVWWRDLLFAAGEKRPTVEWEARLTYVEGKTEDGKILIKEILLAGNNK